MNTTQDSLERGFAIYRERTARLGKEPKHATLEDWAGSPAGMRYAASHGLLPDAEPETAPERATERAGVTMDDLLDQLTARLLQRGGVEPQRVRRSGTPPVFLQGHQPKYAPVLPNGFTYGRCTTTRRGVEQVTIRVPFDQLEDVAAALHDLRS